MSNIVEQRGYLKFCVSKKISCAEALKMLTAAYGDSTMSKTQAYEWYKEFKTGRSVVDDLPRSGRPSTSVNDENIEKVKKIVLADRRVSIREIAADIGVSLGSAQSVMHRMSRTVVDDLPRSGRPSTSVTHENIENVKKIVFADRRVSIKEIAGVSLESARGVKQDNLGMRRVEARLDETHSSTRPNVAKSTNLDPLSSTQSERKLRKRARITTQKNAVGKRKLYSIGGSANVRDDDEIFCQSILPLMRQLEPVQKSICRTEIQNIIHKHLFEKGKPKDPPIGLTKQIRNDNSEKSEDTI